MVLNHIFFKTKTIFFTVVSRLNLFVFTDNCHDKSNQVQILLLILQTVFYYSFLF